MARDRKTKTTLDELADKYVQKTLLESIETIRIVTWLQDDEFFVVLRLPRVRTIVTALLVAGALLWRVLVAG